MADFSKVLERDGQNSTALFHRGCCYEALKQLDRSIEDYSRALLLESRVGDLTLEGFKEAD